MKKTTSERQLAGAGQEGRMIFLGQKVLEELRILARLAKGAVIEPSESPTLALLPITRRRNLP